MVDCVLVGCGCFLFLDLGSMEGRVDGEKEREWWEREDGWILILLEGKC